MSMPWGTTYTLALQSPNAAIAGICAASATVSPSVISLSAFSILLLFWRADVAQWEQQVDGSLKHHQPTQQLDL